MTAPTPISRGAGRGRLRIDAGACAIIRGSPSTVPPVTALIAHCSCPDAATAARIARVLVEERLAACVQVVPGLTSTYRWQGEVQSASEVLLLIKTSRARLDALKSRLPALHPYDLPELIALDACDGLGPYLAWIAAETL